MPDRLFAHRPAIADAYEALRREAPPGSAPAGFAEQVALDVHGLTDADVAAVVAERGPAGLITALSAAALDDAEARLRRLRRDLGRD